LPLLEWGLRTGLFQQESRQPLSLSLLAVAVAVFDTVEVAVQEDLYSVKT
jgi:hypothetical protein